jgi:hypothetical protein
MRRARQAKYVRSFIRTLRRAGMMMPIPVP